MSDYQYDNEGQVVLSKVVSDNPKAPTMRIRTEINGVKYATGLWPMTRKDGSLVKDKEGNQLYRGKLEEDDYEAKPEKPVAPQHRQPPADDFDDSSIPF